MSRRQRYCVITPAYSSVKRWARQDNIPNIYHILRTITSNMDEAENAANWCKIAKVGDTYKSEIMEIKIIEAEE